MSLVGTRPPTVDEFEQYSAYHKKRLCQKPGLTGVWQVSGRSTITDFEEIVQMDVDYIDHWSIWRDIGILIKTVWLTCCSRWQTWMIHKKLFHCSMWPYMKKLLIYTIVTIVACLITYGVIGLVKGNGIIDFCIKTIICIILPNILFLIISFKTKEFKLMLETIRKIIKK